MVDNKNRDFIRDIISKEKRVSEIEFDFRIKTGEIKKGLYSAEILKVNNQLILLSNVSDISSKKKNQEKLYLPEDNNIVSSGKFLPKLFRNIVDIFPDSDKIILKTDIEEIEFSSKTTSTIGIIINEFITNSMKHAFCEENTEPIISISLKNIDNQLTITYEDNGCGIPDTICPEESTGFGLQLANMLLKQLNGNLVLDREHGSKFLIKIPM